MGEAKGGCGVVVEVSSPGSGAQLLQMEFNLEEKFAATGAKAKATCESGAEPSGNSHDLLCVHYQSAVGLFAGRSDGQILHWKEGVIGHTKSQASFLSGHQGAVYCLVFSQVRDCKIEGLLFSGSADRSVKIWNPKPQSQESACVQTLVGHGGTITALQILGNCCLITCSIDRTLIIWRADSGRSLLLHPWFSKIQTIPNGGSWPTTTAVRVGEIITLYVGDSNGTLSVYNCPSLLSSSKHSDSRFELKRRHVQIHDLSISSILLVSEQNMIISLSYDNHMHVFDAVRATILFSVANENNCQFTCCDWDPRHQHLFVSDAMGYLYIYNIFTEDCLKKTRIHKQKILSITLVSLGKSILVTLGNGCLKYEICRDIKFRELSGHTDSVISVVPALSISNEESVEKYKFFSASLDNTLRCWDTFSEDKSEFSCMIHCSEINKLVTGHEDGSMRLWNPDTGRATSVKEHTNTLSCLCEAVVGREYYVISGGFDGRICIWDLGYANSTQAILHYASQENEDLEILAICFLTGSSKYDSYRSDTYASAGNDNCIKIWNFRNNILLHILKGHTDAITCMVADGVFLFSGSEDLSIRIWNLSNVKEGYELGVIETGHLNAIQDLVHLPNTSYIISCAYDGKIRVWDYQFDTVNERHGQLVYEFRHHEELRCLAYRKSTQDLVCGTNENSLLLFTLPDQVRT